MSQTRSDELARLTGEIARCRVCVETPRGAPLPHEPRPVVWPSATAKICVAGQAPGTRVHASGTPFTDPSGDRLRAWMGIEAETFYDRSRIAIVPMGFCFPGLDAKGGDKPPRKECAATWHPHLFEAMPQLELILLIGSHAQKYHLGKAVKPTLTETVAHWRDYRPRFIVLPHPSWRNNAWIRKHPWFEEDLLPVLRADVASRV